jgi:hypothetical protein
MSAANAFFMSLTVLILGSSLPIVPAESRLPLQVALP